MKVRQARVKGQNERLSIVVDDNGMPIDRINFFIVEELRGLADSTLLQRVRIVVHIENWAREREVSLEDEMAGTCLSKDALFSSLISHLHKKSQNELGENVIALNPEQVSVDYFNQRIALCEVYFEYLNNKFLSRVKIDNTNIENNKIFFDKLIKRLKKRLISGKNQSNVKGLNRLQQASLARGLNETGFFKWNKTTKERNKLIILMLYEAGIRKGELLSLTIGNCHTNVDTPYIAIKENISHSDPRNNIPQVKTLERVIPISKKLALLIDNYKLIRSQNEDALKQPPFLFLSTHKPFNPLAINSIDGIFETVRETLPNITKFSTHILRHTRFENLDKYMVSQGYSDAYKTKVKNTLGGWSRNSRTSENYEKNATEEQVQSVIKGLQDEIDGGFY